MGGGRIAPGTRLMGHRRSQQISTKLLFFRYQNCNSGIVEAYVTGSERVNRIILVCFSNHC